MLGESGFVMDVRGDQVKLVFLSQDPEKQHHSATSTFPHSIIDHLTGEGQDLNTNTHKNMFHYVEQGIPVFLTPSVVHS